MEVGKKYRSERQFVNCVLITPKGNAVIIDCDGIESLVYKNSFNHWKEVKEKQKVYVFLVEVNGVMFPHSFNRKINAESSVKLFSNTSYRLVSDIVEVEIEVK